MLSQEKVQIRIACSLDKLDLFQYLVKRFNEIRYESAAGMRIVIECIPLPLEPDLAILSASNINAVTPESSLWLRDLNIHTGISSTQGVFASPATLYAASPISIVMWEDVARSFDYPKHTITWKNILGRSRESADFRWGQPSVLCPSGQLSILAMLEKRESVEEIIEADLQDSASVTELNQLQQTITYYAPSEIDLILRAKEEGKTFLDAFVIQEHFAIRFNRETNDPLVIILPMPSTVWADHPIALLRFPEPSLEQIEAYQYFCTYLLSSNVQARFLANGFHPIGSQVLGFLQTEKERIESSIPQLGMSHIARSARLSSDLSGLATRKLFSVTKKNTNVILVVDTSSSMSGGKLDRVKEALITFIEQVVGQDEQVGLITFNSFVESTIPIAQLRDSRGNLASAISSLCAEGRTALIDAVDSAYVQLQRQGANNRINAIIALTDGQENASNISEDSLVHKIAMENENLTPVLIYCIAYGTDADLRSLDRIASASRGKVYEGNSTDITDVYDKLSRMF